MDTMDWKTLLEWPSSSWRGISDISTTQELISQQLLSSHVLGFTGKWKAVLLNILPDDSSPDLKNHIYELVEGSFGTIWGATGTGKKTDKYNDELFRQLVIVDSNNTLMWWYRVAPVKENIFDGQIHSPMGDFFQFNQNYLEYIKQNNYLELWTARINKQLDDRQKIYPLFGLWDGIAYLADEYKSNGFIGKLTIPTRYNADAADFTLSYLTKFFGTGVHDVATPKKDIYDYRVRHTDEKLKTFDTYLQTLTGDYLKDEKPLQAILREICLASATPGQLETRFPNMFPMYLSRLSSLHYMGTIKNGNVSESWIGVSISDIHDSVRETHFGVVEKRKKQFGKEKMSLREYLVKLHSSS